MRKFNAHSLRISLLSLIVPVSAIVNMKPLYAQTDSICAGNVNKIGSCQQLVNDKEIVLLFNGEGKLLSAPPERLNNGDKIHFQVRVSADNYRKNVRNNVNRLLNLERNTRNMLLIDTAKVTLFRNQLLYELRYIELNYFDLLAADQKAKLRRVFMMKSNIKKKYCYHKSYKTYIPSFESLITDRFTIEVMQKQENGGILSCHKMNFKLSCLQCDERVYTSGEIKIEVEDLSELSFQLRQDNTEYILYEELAIPEKENILVDTSVLAELRQDLKKFDKTYDSLYLLASTFRDSLETDTYSTIPGQLATELRKAMQNTYTVNHLKKLKSTGDMYLHNFEDYFLSQLWMWEQSWYKSFHTQRSVKDVTGAVGVNKKALEVSIDELKKEINRLTQWETDMRNWVSNLQCKNCSPLPDFNPYADSLLTKAKIRNNLEKQKDSLSKLLSEQTVEFDNIQDRWLVEKKWLYSGILIANNGKQSTLMHHLDASNDLLFMRKKPSMVITEDEYLMPFIHNLKSNESVEIRYEFNFIPGYQMSTLEINSGSYINEKMNGEKPLEFSKTLSDSNNLSELVNMFLARYELVLFYRQIIESLPVIPVIIEQLPDKANYRTETQHYNFPDSVPAVGTYIARTGNDSVEVKFGIRRLYRLRYKFGATYSWLTTNDYTLQNNQATLSENRKGLSASMGVQYFLQKNDVTARGPYLLSQIYLYAGLPISSKIDHFYLGGGIEPVDGLGLTVGWNFGPTERLVDRGGVLEVNKDAWTSGYFVSIGFDLSVFNSLFTNSFNVTNPF